MGTKDGALGKTDWTYSVFWQSCPFIVPGGLEICSYKNQQMSLFFKQPYNCQNLEARKVSFSTEKGEWDIQTMECLVQKGNESQKVLRKGQSERVSLEFNCMILVFSKREC